MKRISFLFLFLLVCTIAYSQSKTFDCGLFSFTYPSKFKSTPINNAPHMVLKLSTDQEFFSASYWDYKIDEGVSIWDEEFVERAKTMPTQDGEQIVSVTKETIHTRGGARRCLKIMSNLYAKNQGKIVPMKMVYYNMISEGYLFVFLYSTPGECHANSSTGYADFLMKGLKFKGSLRKAPPTDFQSQLKETVKVLNEQCPFQADECTIHERVVLTGSTIMFRTTILDECYDFIDFDLFKRKMCESFANVLEKPFVEYLDRHGYSIMYLISDESQVVKKRVEITSKDILKFYKTNTAKKETYGI